MPSGSATGDPRAVEPQTLEEPAATHEEHRLPRLWRGSRRWMLIRLILIGLGQAAAAVGTALLIEAAYERFITRGLGPGGIEPSAFAWVGGGLLAAAVVGAALRAAERIQAEKLGQDYTYQVRLSLYDRLTTLAPRTLQRRSQGAVSLRFVGDLNAIRQWVSLGLARLVVAITMVTGALAAMATINVVLAGGLAVVLALGAAGTLGLGRPVRTAAVEVRRSRARLAANVNQQVGAIAVVQAFGQAGRERKLVKKQSRRLREASVVRARVAGWLQGLAEATAALATGTVLLLGAYEVSAGRAQPATVVAALAIVGVLVSPIRDLGRVVEFRQNAVVSREKLVTFLRTASTTQDLPGVADLAPGPGRLAFEEVSVEGSLRGVSAVAEAGSTIAVVGPNGAGKSTLLGLAARLVEPSAGTVRLDGQDLTERSLDSIHKAISIAAPDVPLLRGTLDRNLRYRWKDAPAAELARVRALCLVDEVLAELPDGIETKVAEDGKGLSAGQRQRIALARAMLGDPTVLLLDEADANMDAAATAAVDRVLAAFPGTVLLVTHGSQRLSTADEVWHLEGGRLVETGPPAELLAGDGPTARLFRSGEPAREDAWSDPSDDGDSQDEGVGVGRRAAVVA